MSLRRVPIILNTVILSGSAQKIGEAEKLIKEAGYYFEDRNRL